jgi:hypothetical protein
MSLYYAMLLLTFHSLGFTLANRGHRGRLRSGSPVCLYPSGPVAVKHTEVKDKPIKDLLGNVNSTLVDKLVQHVYNGDVSKIPTVDY